MAVDEFGNTWSFDNIWTRDYIEDKPPQDPIWKVMTRTNSNFSDMLESENTKALDKLLNYCKTCITSFDDFALSKTITYQDRIAKLDNPEIQKNMKIEAEKAQIVMDQILE